MGGPVGRGVAHAPTVVGNQLVAPLLLGQFEIDIRALDERVDQVLQAFEVVQAHPVIQQRSLPFLLQVEFEFRPRVAAHGFAEQI